MPSVIKREKRKFYDQEFYLKKSDANRTRFNSYNSVFKRLDGLTMIVF